MERALTVAESAARRKDIPKRVSSRQTEARITACTVIFTAIIINILWWVGSQSIQWETSPAASLEAVQPEVHRTGLK